MSETCNGPGCSCDIGCPDEPCFKWCCKWGISIKFAYITVMNDEDYVIPHCIAPLLLHKK